MKKLIACIIFAAMIISACTQQRRVVIDQGNGSNGGTNNGNGQCQLSTNSVQFEPVIQVGTNPKVNETVLWRLTLPAACGGSLIVKSDLTTESVPSNSTVIQTSYSTEGEKIEEITIIHPASDQRVTVSGRVTVVASDDPGDPEYPFIPLTCNASVEPESKSVKVDINGRLIEEAPRFEFRVITSRPAILSEWFLIPDPSAISDIIPNSTGSSIAFSAKISHVGVNAMLFTVFEPPSGAFGFCFTIFRLEPIVEEPVLPNSWITANGEMDEIEIPDGGIVVLEWGSSNADDCVINPFEIHSLGGYKLVYNINETVEYEITCTNRYGGNVSKVRVVVPPVKGSVSFHASNAPPYLLPKNFTGDESKSYVKGSCGWKKSSGLYPAQLSDSSKFKPNDKLKLTNVSGSFCDRSKGWNYCKNCCFIGDGCEEVESSSNSDFNRFKIGFYRSNSMTSSNIPIAEYTINQILNVDIEIPSGTQYIYIYYLDIVDGFCSNWYCYFDNNPQYKMSIDYTITRQ